MVASLDERKAPLRAGSRRLAVESIPIVPFTLTAASMGGRLEVHLDAEGRTAEAREDVRRLIARIDRWAARLTRHTDNSDLALLNADGNSAVAVRPTLAAALLAGMVAADASEGFADITLLDARLTAEGKNDLVAPSRRGEWQLADRPRGAAVVRRPPGLRFDLGGVGKGWIADRALALLTGWPSAVVDADGDIAVLCAPGKLWEVGIGDPRTEDSNLAVLKLTAPLDGGPTHWGVATSGTSVHRWNVGGTVRHHLIDPRTGRPAETDVIQATVVAGSALRAEALAKAAVIAGSVEGFALLDRARVLGAVLLTSSGEVRALPATLSLLGD
jgi:thiamine biosynthesis lipoprotein